MNSGASISKFKMITSRIPLWAWRDALLIISAIAITAWKLSGLFAYPDELLPGWDTLPHFYLFERFLSLLQDGRFSGYNSEQLGGFPLFYFYSPLSFLLGALIKIIGAGEISTIFAWRLFLFFNVVSFILAFWFFARVFAHRSIGGLTIAIALFYIFYPSGFRAFGIGATATIIGGLFASSLAITFALISLAFLELFRETNKSRYAAAGALCFAATILSHPMIGGFLFLITAIYLLSASGKKFFITYGSIPAYGIALALFFILPILFYSPYQSSNAQDGRAPILALLMPFTSLIHGTNIPVAYLTTQHVFLFTASLFITIFFFYGLLRSREHAKHRAIRNIFLVTLILQFFGEFLTNTLHFVPIHYYRLSPFLLIFYFAIALIGFSLY